MEGSMQALESALQYHQAGRLQEAEQAYRKILEVDPNNVAAWHLLGRLAGQLADWDAAVRCISHALRLWPTYAEAQSDLGTIFEARGELEKAAAAYRQAVGLKPNYAVAHFNLGNVLKQQGKPHEAAACFRQAIAANPDFAPAHTSLGTILVDEARLDEAAAHFDCALKLDPHYARAHFGKGYVLQRWGSLDNAQAYYRRALELQPTDVDAQYNLGTLLEQRGDFEGAIASYRRVLDLKSDHLGANNNLGRLLWAKGCTDEARSRIGTALQIDASCAEAYHNLAVVHADRQEWEQAATCLEKAIGLKPDLADPHVTRAHFWLLKGDFEQGWQEYEWRWKAGQVARVFERPVWSGEPVAGKTVLVHAEQGAGDVIQFVRYAAVLKRLGATVIFECQKPLLKLLASCPGIDVLIGYGEPLPEFDFFTPLLSIPRVLKTAVHTIPAEAPYLFADQRLMAEWREKLRPIEGFRIGINWHGRTDIPQSQRRDVPVQMFEGGNRNGEFRMQNSESFPIVNVGEFDTEHGAFMDTAAIMMNLDLVITSDTSVAHLAGALGVQVWVALPLVPDWRWLLDRNDSPWYPTMRLFRQKQVGDWAGVFEEIEAALRELVGGR
jgi:tetratricopeptide (TPR) repeat protein